MYKAIIILFAAVNLITGKPVEEGDKYDWRIVGGQVAPNGSFTYMASLRSVGNSHFCGGFIITALTIGTAGHCVAGERPETMMVVVGTNHIKEGGTKFGVRSILLHPDFDYWNLFEDVALVKLNESIAFNGLVQPIPLGVDHTPGRVMVTLSGWGRTSYPGEVATQLQFIELVTIENTDCRNKLSNIGSIYDSNICTLTKSGEGACHGDSGSALVVDRKVVGIVSWGSPCARGLPDVYCRVSTVSRWMLDNIE